MPPPFGGGPQVPNPAYCRPSTPLEPQMPSRATTPLRTGAGAPSAGLLLVVSAAPSQQASALGPWGTPPRTGAPARNTPMKQPLQHRAASIPMSILRLLPVRMGPAGVRAAPATAPERRRSGGRAAHKRQPSGGGAAGERHATGVQARPARRPGGANCALAIYGRRRAMGTRAAGGELRAERHASGDCQSCTWWCLK